MNHLRSLKVIFLPAIAGTALFHSAGAATAQVFAPAVNYATDSLPVGIASGDVNRDGFADIISASQGTSTVQLRLGNGTGALGAPIGYATSDVPNEIILADLNNDDYLDMLTASLNNINPTAKYMFRAGTPSGFFGEGSSTLGYSSPYHIVAGDFDLDGGVDAATVSWFTNEVLLSKGNGTGILTLHSGVAVPSIPYAIKAGDLNADGELDLVTGSANAYQFGVLLGGAGMSFTSTAHTSYGTSCVGVNLADFNADSKLDVLLTDNTILPGFPRVVFGSGTGTFPTQAPVALNGMDAGSAVGDLNHDGLVDMLGLGYWTSQMKLVLATGSGTFSPVAQQYTTLTKPANPTLIDLNLDGRIDAVITCRDSDRLQVYLNQSNLGTFMSPFGAGTSGCYGRANMAARGTAYIDNPLWGLTCTGAPKQSLGICIIGTAAIPTAVDLFSVQIGIHVDPFNSTEFYALDIYSDMGTTSFCPIPLPNVNALIGKIYVAQSIWVESTITGQACSTSGYDLYSSNGLQFTIQPPFAP